MLIRPAIDSSAHAHLTPESEMRLCWVLNPSANWVSYHILVFNLSVHTCSFFSGTDPVIEYVVVNCSSLVITNRSILNMPVAKHLNF